MPRCWSSRASRLERDMAVLCPKPWAYTPACLLSALERLELVIVSISATSHRTDGIWEKIISGNS